MLESPWRPTIQDPCCSDLGIALAFLGPQSHGKKSGDKAEEMAGEKKKKKGHAVEKAGEAMGDEAKQMKSSGNDSEKSGVKAKKALAAGKVGRQTGKFHSRAWRCG